MGFLNKLFGGSGEKVADISSDQRAQYKDRKFFNTMLKKKDEMIQMLQKSNDKLAQEGNLKPFNNWGMAMEYLDKVYITYSMGEPIEKCYDLFLEAVRWYEGGWDPDSIYADMVDMISLAYLLQVPDKEFNIVANYIQQADQGSSEPDWKPDGVLWFIINARKPGGAKPDGVIWPEISQEIFEITKMQKPEAEVAMKKYLDKWYKLHWEDPWYENHKKELAYKGYWSWEAGAITKIMQLDDSSFKDNPYYPYDLVHWNKS